ncbi:hypothetical protein HK099_001911 [Clydaea vesicula]|uniref:Alpha N-terminal protein methyltransferase 1 n=1 Tax=Clydaea vesicula TaxID=447962 RepID=A0AAD5Y3D8_9FUNG|nr:hypothetical protein HK099_001911 [Clydaea vesicula]
MNKTEELCYDAMKNKTNYYEIANKYWDNVEPTVNGMLGGFEILTEPDVKDSSSFIQEFVTGNNPRLNTDLCCDCGAGIGRVSKNFLLKYFKKVDLVEQCSNFLETAKKEIFVGEFSNKVDQYINKGLQEFFPEKQRYDLIWNQWVLGKTDSRSGVEDIMGIPDNEKNRKVSNSSLKSKRRLLRLGKRKSDPLVSTSMNNFDNINVNNNVNLTLPNASTTLNNNQIEKKNSSTWTREHNNNVPAITILGIPASKSQQSDTGSKEHLSTSPNTINLVSNNTTQNVKAKKNLNIFHRNKNSNANNSNNITNLAASSNENPFIVRKSISSGCLKEGKPILDLEEDYLQNEFYHQIDSS